MSLLHGLCLSQARRCSYGPQQARAIAESLAVLVNELLMEGLEAGHDLLDLVLLRHMECIGSALAWERALLLQASWT